MTLTAIRPDFVLGSGREVALFRLSQALGVDRVRPRVQPRHHPPSRTGRSTVLDSLLGRVWTGKCPCSVGRVDLRTKDDRIGLGW